MMRELSDVHHLRLHDPMSLQHLLFLLLLHLILIHSSEGADSKPSGYKFNDCPKDSNYTTNSTFQANLNLLLPSLSSAAVAATGYFNTTVGQPPDQVYGHALCRSDFSPSVCQDCLVTAAQAIVELCPAGKQSTMAYDDCIVRYSDESFFGTADVNPVIYVYITQNVSDPQAFESLLGNFMNGLETEATKDSSKLFAAGAVNMTSFTDVYGLVQCTRDLPAEECSRCINIFIGKLSLCCQYKTGGAVYGRSCFIRYDFDLFYNITAVYATNSPPQPPPPQPPPPPPPQLLDSGPEAPKGGKQLLE